MTSPAKPAPAAPSTGPTPQTAPRCRASRDGGATVAHREQRRMPLSIQVPDLRPHFAVYAMALLLAALNVFEIPRELSWIPAVAIATGALVTQRLIARRRLRSPPYEGVVLIGFLFHLVASVGVVAAVVLHMREIDQPLVADTSELYGTPLYLIGMAFGMNVLFLACMSHAIFGAARGAVRVSHD